MEHQLCFDLDFSPRSTPYRRAETVIKRSALVQTALLWLTRQGVAGLCTDVPTRLRRYKANVAAFWNTAVSNPSPNGPSKRYVPCETVLVECRRSREQCWPDTAKSNILLPQMLELKSRRAEMECEIRVCEPGLQDASVLFEEYSEWHYDKSDNPAYQKLRRQITKIEAALYKGSRFEALRKANVADSLYLAVPERTVHPHELAEGWGLLWISENQKLRVIAEAERRVCTDENRFHLVQNIAAMAQRHVLFSHGVYNQAEDYYIARQPRRRRRPPQAEK